MIKDLKMEDLKIKVNYNFAGDYLTFLASLSNFQEEGTVNCAVTRAMLLADPVSVIQNSLNALIGKLVEEYFTEEGTLINCEPVNEKSNL
jgi:hypothetical protein